jgi:hypothetical protein
MRTLSLALLVLLGSAHVARGQGPNADFVHGRDDVFDRMEATRPVNDEEDQGTLRLVSYVYCPLKNDRHEVVLFSIGLELQTPRLAKAAKQFTGPSIWIYAVRDPLHREDAPRRLLDAWRDAGGQAEFVYIAEHTLVNAHLALTAALWERQMASFLDRIDNAKQ